MNQNKSLPFVIACIVLIVGLGVVMAQQNTKSKSEVKTDITSQTPQTTKTDTTTPKSTTTTTQTPKATTPAVASYTMAQVSTHSSSSDCWTAINGNVYNVTSWISQHPGGAGAIISLCGVDGSSEFNDEHGGQRRPASELASFKIGILK